MLSKRRGLTMIEVVVVIILVMVVFGVITIYLEHERSKQGRGDRVTTLFQLSSMAQAVHNYHGTYGKFPPAWGAGAPSPMKAATIHYYLLPFVEQDNLYNAYNPAATVYPFIAAYPDSSLGDGAGVQNFAANLRLFSKLGVDTAYNADIAFGDPNKAATWDTGDGAARLTTCSDGRSNVIMFATRYANNTRYGIVPGAPNCSAHAGRPYHADGAFFGTFAAKSSAGLDTSLRPTFQLAPRPTEVDCEFSGFAHSYATYGILIAMADGSWRALNASISAETWNRAMQPNDGLELGDYWNE